MNTQATLTTASAGMQLQKTVTTHRHKNHPCKWWAQNRRCRCKTVLTVILSNWANSPTIDDAIITSESDCDVYKRRWRLLWCRLRALMALNSMTRVHLVSEWLYRWPALCLHSHSVPLKHVKKYASHKIWLPSLNARTFWNAFQSFLKSLLDILRF